MKKPQLAIKLGIIPNFYGLARVASCWWMAHNDDDDGRISQVSQETTANITGMWTCSFSVGETLLCSGGGEAPEKMPKI